MSLPKREPQEFTQFETRTGQRARRILHHRSRNDPPAKPEAFRLLAPQRGLIATEEAKTPSLAQHVTDLIARQTPEKANSRICQTSTASPAKPGGLSSD
jgi:hypothetical protein